MTELDATTILFKVCRYQMT